MAIQPPVILNIWNGMTWKKETMIRQRSCESEIRKKAVRLLPLIFACEINKCTEPIQLVKTSNIKHKSIHPSKRKVTSQTVYDSFDQIAFGP